MKLFKLFIFLCKIVYENMNKIISFKGQPNMPLGSWYTRFSSLFHVFLPQSIRKLFHEAITCVANYVDRWICESHVNPILINDLEESVTHVMDSWNNFSSL